MQNNYLKKVIVLAPAKLNLALDVTGLAENGYHTVDMIMQAISLYEKVEITRSAGYSLRCPKSPVPCDERNTATKAAAAFFAQTGLLAGADITIHKTVPTRAGLAGGSADAAAVLWGLNALYGARLPLEELCRIGATVGADVPFALMGGTARVRGIGDELTPLPPLPNCWFAVAMPKGGVSTPEAYRRYDEMGSPLHPSIDSAETAIRNGNLQVLAVHMQNALEHSNGDETTAKIRAAFDAQGAIASMMTGSGAAVFGMYNTQQQAKAGADAACGFAAQVFVVQPVAIGPRIANETD